jgi:hypothetical protein
MDKSSSPVALYRLRELPNAALSMTIAESMEQMLHIS